MAKNRKSGFEESPKNRSFTTLAHLIDEVTGALWPRTDHSRGPTGRWTEARDLGRTTAVVSDGPHLCLRTDSAGLDRRGGERIHHDAYIRAAAE